MAIAYSQDLRKRAVELIESGMSLISISRILKISRPTLYKWRKQWEMEGTTLPKKSTPPPQPAKITEWERFKEFVDAHGDKTQQEMAQLWGSVSYHTIARGLKKINYTRKKKLTPI